MKFVAQITDGPEIVVDCPSVTKTCLGWYRQRKLAVIHGCKQKKRGNSCRLLGLFESC